MAADMPEDRVKSSRSKKSPAAQTSAPAIPVPPPSPAPAASTDPVAEREMRHAEELALAASSLGSGLLARQATTESAITVPVLKVCPQCGTEFETSVRFCPSDGTALRPKGSDSLIGRVMAERYHILKRIGEGGMGRVYLGEHVKMNRQCAIKVMNPALVNDHESAARFAREASSAARIIHPNVAAVFDYGESEGLVYLVMEYVDGEPLSRILAREAPLSLERSLDIARQIADGLGSAHELGIVHRDLKPDNILVSRNKAGKEVAKVVDFGIAKAIKENASDALTRTGLVIGTPEFMSPEQLLGDPVDARSDLYALGCILHLMLTASPPFAAQTREQMIKRRLTEDAPHVQQLDAGLPDSLDRIVAKLLARSPAERYASAAEVRDALSGAHVRSHDVRDMLHVSQPTPRSAPTLSFESAMIAPTEQTHAVVAPRRRAAMIAVGAVVVIGGALAIRGVRQGGGDAVVAQPARESLAQRSVAVPPPAVTPPVRAPVKKTVPAVDSAVLRARRARRDSIRAAEAKPGSVSAAISRYARAIESGSVNTLKEAYPNLTPQQQEYWETNVFAKAERIKASVRDVQIKENGSTAEATFTVNVVYNYKAAAPGSFRLQQHATLAMTPKGWQIAEIK